jgi:hypothetical protein
MEIVHCEAAGTWLRLGITGEIVYLNSDAGALRLPHAWFAPGAGIPGRI